VIVIRNNHLIIFYHFSNIYFIFMNVCRFVCLEIFKMFIFMIFLIFKGCALFTSLSIKPIPLHILFLMLFRKVPYWLLPYTISSQPIRPRATRVKLPHLRMILRSLCPVEIPVWFAIYCNDTSVLFPRTSSSER
jgi:hypothetical protein